VTATPPYDSRGVANMLLDLADARGLRVTNLTLQKLLYFAHGQFLVTRGLPLVDGYFEAWRYGPVHPTVYNSFKVAESGPIRERAVGFDYRLQQAYTIAVPDDRDAREHVERVLIRLGQVPAGRLIEISHAPRGPWAETVNKSGTNAVLGLQISDRMTAERFRFLMVPLKPEDPSGAPLEDTPLA
jgi:uncharacterized phage-associated protein